jgi:hypothetical protein
MALDKTRYFGTSTSIRHDQNSYLTAAKTRGLAASFIMREALDMYIEANPLTAPKTKKFTSKRGWPKLRETASA